MIEDGDALSEEDFASMHIESYNIHPDECDRCNEGPCYLVKFDKGGLFLAHEGDLEKV